MGKVEQVHQSQSTILDARAIIPNGGNSDRCFLTCYSRVKKLVNFKCVFVLVLGIGVLLSAIYWLPFFHFGDREYLDLDYAGHDIVASFMLRKQASFLKTYTLQLEDNIFDEMRFSSTKVEVLSLESLCESNTTKVVFAVKSDATTLSLIRNSFVTLVTHRSFLQFIGSLFGNPFSFDVLKFKGGITATPDQKAFLLQQVQILFNFTLNFSIDQLINNFDELTSQLKTGLHLDSYENLYVRLTNLKGSTVYPPTIVESQVLLAIGIPSKSRFKQLAQTITGSHSKNLGLNNTVFGHVKQVRLSSVLQHLLDNGGTSPSPSPLPSPSPTPKSRSYYHHPNHDSKFSPTISPSASIISGGSMVPAGSPESTPLPASAPGKNKAAQPPCLFGYNNRFPWKLGSHSPLTPYVQPTYAPNAAPPHLKQRGSTPSASPVPAKGPSPKVAYTHQQPKSHSEYHAWPPDAMPLTSPSPSPSSAGLISSHVWRLLLFILLGLYL